jgi:large subunit ribosomal protein L24
MLKNKETPKRRWLDLAPGDPVVVTAGKDKGKTGEVLRTIPDKHKIVVKGVNILKRHTKAGRSRGGVSVAQGGVVDFEAPLDYSNVMLVCPACSRPTRTKHIVLESGARALVCRHCGEPYERVIRRQARSRRRRRAFSSRTATRSCRR